MHSRHFLAMDAEKNKIEKKKNEIPIFQATSSLARNFNGMHLTNIFHNNNHSSFTGEKYIYTLEQ